MISLNQYLHTCLHHTFQHTNSPNLQIEMMKLYNIITKTRVISKAFSITNNRLVAEYTRLYVQNQTIKRLEWILSWPLNCKRKNDYTHPVKPNLSATLYMTSLSQRGPKSPSPPIANVKAHEQRRAVNIENPAADLTTSERKKWWLFKPMTIAEITKLGFNRLCQTDWWIRTPNDKIL